MDHCSLEECWWRISLASTLKYLGRDIVRQAKVYADSQHEEAEVTDSDRRESTQHLWTSDAYIQRDNRAIIGLRHRQLLGAGD